eukprot:COSAG06_NODE_63566_length_262_cov_0.607362_1_plen_32_part_10
MQYHLARHALSATAGLGHRLRRPVLQGWHWRG